MAIEPPLKKRKNYDADAGRSSSQTSELPALSAEEKVMRKRNRDEISSFYKLYRRLKFCVDRERSAVSITATPSRALEEAYCSILKLSSGCSSVQRIAAEIIPRYVAFCPHAIDLASNALIQILEWNEDAVFQDEDLDGVAFNTVEACLAGMVEMSSAAAHIASNVPGDISDMLTAVCHNIAYYLLCRLEGRDVIMFDVHKCEEELESYLECAHTTQDKLSTLLSFNLVKLFYLHPQSIFTACFEYLGSTDEKHRKEGQRFLSQIMGVQNENVNLENVAQVFSNDGEEMNNDSRFEDVECSREKQKASSDSLIMKVVYSNSILERWLVSTFHEFSRSASSDAVAESLSLLTTLLQSLSTFKEIDLDPYHEEAKQTAEKADAIEGVNLEGEPQDVESGEGVFPIAVEKEAGPDAEEGHVSMGDNENASSGIDAIDKSQLEKVESLDDKVDEMAIECISLKEDNEECIYSEKDNKDVSKGDDLETESVDLSAHAADSDEFSCENEHDSKHDVTSSLREEMIAEGNFEEGGLDPHGVLDEGGLDPHGVLDAHFSDTEITRAQTLPASTYLKEKSEYIPSLGEFANTKVELSSSNAGHATWYADGDVAALDVFAASKKLWVGNIGPGVTESIFRYEFEKFGSIESVSVFPGQDFMFVEYKSILDAVRAREILQDAAPWSMPLKIRFLDLDFSNQGSIGGVAVGGNCYVYVGRVFSQVAKDDLMNDISCACVKGPSSVCFLRSANALLLEFIAPEEAAAVMLYVRQRRREGGYVSQQFAKSDFASESMDNSSHFQARLVERPVPLINSTHSTASLFSSTTSSSAWQELQPAVSYLQGDTSSRKNMKGSNTSAAFAYQPRSFRSSGDPGRMTAKILRVRLLENAILSFPSDTELRTIFNLASKGAGKVMKMSTVRTVHGSCRFLEFDCVEAATRALENCAGHLDPNIQVEFSDPVQHGEYAYATVIYQFEETRSLWEREQDRARTLCSPIRPSLVDLRSGLSGTTKWGHAHSGVNPDDSNYNLSRYGSPSEIKEGILNIDPAMSRFTYRSIVELDGPPISHSSNLPWFGSARTSLEHHSSLGSGLESSSMPQPTVPSSLPSLTRPSHIDLERPPLGASWCSSGERTSSDTSMMNVSLSSIGMGPIMKSPGGLTVSQFSLRLSPSFERQNPPVSLRPPVSPPPPPSLDTPSQPPPDSPSSFQSPSFLQPHSPSMKICSIKKDTQSNLSQHHWQGPLCKSGFQYCEVVVYAQDSPVCHSGVYKEPARWPNKLEVTKRADFRSVTHSFLITEESQRRVCRLSPCPGNKNQEGFQNFSIYLRQRDRAGVVVIPESGMLKARVLFIFPWSQEIGDLLIIPHLSTDNLIGLVLPMDTAFS